MTMGYLSGMIWCYSTGNPGDTHIRIDYEKYLNDEPDIFYHITDSGF